MPAVGETAPDFDLLDEEGKHVKLSDFRGKKVVLYFYPADFTGGCELQACQFRDHYAEIQAKNGIVLGVSPDGVESHKKFHEALNLPFQLLVDTDHTVTRTYDSFGPRKGDDSGKDRVNRGQFVIDENGKIVDKQTPVTPKDSAPLALEHL